MTAKVAWFTGLSGSGKTTIANAAAEILRGAGWKVRIIDGDVVRKSTHLHLGFSPADIKENNRLIVKLCQQLRDDYGIILVPIISPFRALRMEARRALGSHFFEIYVRASLDVVAARDPKGLYRQAREGKLTSLIGVAAEVPYEPPEAPDLVLDTESRGQQVCARDLVSFLTGSHFQYAS